VGGLPPIAPAGPAMSEVPPRMEQTSAQHLIHLAQRFFASFSRTPPSAEDEAWARSQLLPLERALWSRQAVEDRRHCIGVAKRFADARPDAPRAAVAGALLHDIGKVDAQLGTLGRAVARLVGGRTARMRSYIDHERIGAEWLAEGSSDPVTVELVAGRGPWFPDLERADNA
jgi:hypothetical protein